MVIKSLVGTNSRFGWLTPYFLGFSSVAFLIYTIPAAYYFLCRFTKKRPHIFNALLILYEVIFLAGLIDAIVNVV